MANLSQGSSGPDVQDLQQKLKDLGFDPNVVDGNFGPGTKAAVIAFQQSQGLQADGKAWRVESSNCGYFNRRRWSLRRRARSEQCRSRTRYCPGTKPRGARGQSP